jgi:hypothetical protein
LEIKVFDELHVYALFSYEVLSEQELDILVLKENALIIILVDISVMMHVHPFMSL